VFARDQPPGSGRAGHGVAMRLAFVGLVFGALALASCGPTKGRLIASCEVDAARAHKDANPTDAGEYVVACMRSNGYESDLFGDQCVSDAKRFKMGFDDAHIDENCYKRVD